MVRRSVLFAFFLPLTASALDFRSVQEAAILFDGPSQKAKPLYVIPAGAPVEVVVELPNWSKVRDVKGDLAWIEKARLSPQRTVIVKTPRAEVRTAPEPGASLVFAAEADVWLELVEAIPGGWLKVRHRDGESGYVRMSEVWGY